MSIEQTVKLFLKRYNLLEPKNNIIVAFSGGYDSMCLLYSIHKIIQNDKINLIAIHLNHNWRGEESNNEEKKCKEFCKNMNIQFYSKKLPSSIPHTETAAREARYHFFEECAIKFNSQAILTAHNANDNAETIMYRIIKGTGLTGIEGIQEQRGIYYRPLLSIYRKDIEEYCKNNNLNPNNDSSNNDTKYARNNIRHNIMPKLQEINPNILYDLNELSKYAKETNLIIDKQIKYLTEYSTKDFCALNNTLQNIIVHRFYRTNNFDYDKKTIENIVEFIVKSSISKSGKKVSLTNNKWLFVNTNNIQIITKSHKNNEEISVNKEGQYKIGQYIIKLYKNNTCVNKFPTDSEETAYIQLDNFDNLTIRTRRDGDFIQPLGTKGTQKLKKYYNEKKIANHLKDDIILLCKNKEILWVAGYGLSDKIKVTNKATHIISIERR